jgi:hypothetical protein
MGIALLNPSYAPGSKSKNLATENTEYTEIFQEVSQALFEYIKSHSINYGFLCDLCGKLFLG